MSDVVAVERIGRVAVLRLNRPEALNAISMELARGVAAGLIGLDNDDGGFRSLVRASSRPT